MSRPIYKKKRFLIPAVLVLGLALGPRPDYPEFDGVIPQLEVSLAQLPDFVEKANANVQDLKPENEAKLIWADSIRQTEYALVYLHGFSASPVEGNPVHQNIAQRYGMNLYVPLLAEHGRGTKESFKSVSPKDWIDDAKEAIAIGQKLGKKVILMSCSTGSTLANYISAQNPDLIHAQIMYSPNFALDDGNSKIMTYPWGRQLVKALVGGEYRKMQATDLTVMEPYWTTEYHINGVIALQSLLDNTMSDATFKAIDEPWFIGYWYKNEEVCDRVISIPRIHEFAELSSTPADKQRKVAFPDANGHVFQDAS